VSASKYDPLDMALSLQTPGRTPSGASTPSSDSGARSVPVERRTRRQLNVRVQAATAERLRGETFVIAATHSMGDVIDWLVEHHLEDAVRALESVGAARRNGISPRRSS
jgi:hypothetical protein